MAVLVLVLESMAANAGFEINSLTCCVLTSFRKVYWKTTSVLLFGLLFQSAGSDDESIQKANIEGHGREWIGTLGRGKVMALMD